MSSRWRMGTGIALLIGAASAVAAACGARSELDQLPAPATSEGGSTPIDAGRDATVDAPVDAPEDVRMRPDAPPECDDPATTWIYLVSDDQVLVAYKPESNQFKTIGTIVCPGTAISPFSMADDYDGIAYVLDNSTGRLWG